MRLFPWSLGLGVLSLVIADFGCDGEAETTTSSSSRTSSSQGGSTGGSGGAPTTGGAGGDGGAATVCEDVDAATLVAHHLYLGNRDWNDYPSSVAWELYGFNIDGIATANGDLTGHCQPNTGGSPNAMNDGPGGLDNSWGKNLIPVFVGLDPTFSVQHNEAIENGDVGSFLLKLDALGAGGNQQPIVTKLYAAAPLFSAPALDGSDCWPVAYESLQRPSEIESALTAFSSSVLRDNLWDSVDTGTVDLELAFGTARLALHVEHARLTMQLDADHQGATQGILSGVLETEAFIEAFRKVVGTFSQDLCEGTTFDSLANQLRQASDIMADGSQNPNATCNAISFAIGFDATAVRFGAIANPAMPAPDPCAP